MDLSLKKIIENESLTFFVIVVILFIALSIAPIIYYVILLTVVPQSINFFAFLIYGNGETPALIPLLAIDFLFIPFSIVFPHVVGVLYMLSSILVGIYVSKKLHFKIKRTKKQKIVRMIIMVSIGVIVFFLIFFNTNWIGFILYAVNRFMYYGSVFYLLYFLSLADITGYYLFISTAIILFCYISGLLVDVAFYLYRKKKHYKLKKIPVEYEYFTPEGKKKYLKKKEEKEKYKKHTRMERILLILGIMFLVIFSFLLLNFLTIKPTKIHIIIEQSTKINIPEDTVIEIYGGTIDYSFLEQQLIEIPDLDTIKTIDFVIPPINISSDGHPSIEILLDMQKLHYILNISFSGRQFNITSASWQPLGTIVYSINEDISAFNLFNGFSGILSKYVVITSIELNATGNVIFRCNVFDVFNPLDIFTLF